MRSPTLQCREAITGTPYQEVLTNFPLGSQILTGLFLNVTLSGAGTTSETFSRTLVDRIGYAARQGLAPPENLSVSPSGVPVISAQDAYTISVLAGNIDPDVGAALSSEMNQTENQLTTLSQAPTSSGTQLSADAVRLLHTPRRGAILSFLEASARTTADLAAISGVTAYYDAPRVTMASDVINSSGDSLSLNLAEDAVQAIASPGQNSGAAEVFQSIYGLIEGGLEAQAFPAASGTTASGVVEIFQAALAKGFRSWYLPRASCQTSPLWPFPPTPWPGLLMRYNRGLMYSCRRPV